jgi:predicted N-acyltransferase
MKPLVRELNSAIYSNTQFDKYDELVKILRNSQRNQKRNKTNAVIKGLYDR